ncbi:anthranilate phosphoribosyltransferase [Novosphingobium sp. M1R2S20]|uniref:Anthranilate phosphoribosyltransferase n=1 Tax=Novosphingobium rhizovicinum TaxID=3228928 RepID=A0ABV3R6J0_9SPHN
MSAVTHPSIAETEALFGRMLDGEMSDLEVTEALLGLSDRGETAEDIAGAVLAMRARMIPVKAPANAIDVCGTGGDGQHSLNVSTAVAIVVAACGVPVAKHGNRAASSKAGGADTLEALGLDLTRASETAEETLADIGIAFLFAQKHHPALARLAPIRKSIGKRTIFNLTGPMCNPGRVTRQLVGVANPVYVPIYRDAMAMVGCGAAMVVGGEEGLDELSIDGPSVVATLNCGNVPERITPGDAGLATHPLDALRGGDAAYNAAALRRLLNGEPGAYRDAVLLNAAAALILAGEATDLRDGAEEAAEVIDKGLAKSLLDCWIATTAK